MYTPSIALYSGQCPGRNPWTSRGYYLIVTYDQHKRAMRMPSTSRTHKLHAGVN